MCVIGDNNGICGGLSLHPCRRVHDVATDEPLTAVHRGSEINQCLTGGDPDPCPHQPSARHEPVMQSLPQLHSGPYRPEGVVAVGTWDAENGHDRVPDILLHHAVPAVNHLGHGYEILGLQRSHVFRVQAAGKRREADHVHEEHGNHPPLLPRGANGRGFLRGAAPGSISAGGTDRVVTWQPVRVHRAKMAVHHVRMATVRPVTGLSPRRNFHDLLLS